MVKNIQTKLKAKGYYNGEIDGTTSNDTANAIRKYQQDNNLPVGSLSHKFIKHIGVEL